jgi:hypothetical protein
MKYPLLQSLIALDPELSDMQIEALLLFKCMQVWS